MGSQKGNFALIMIFSCLGFLAVAGMVYFLTNHAREAESNASVDPQVLFQDYRARVEQALSNPQAVNASVDRNPNQFGCMFSESGSCKGRGGNFLLFEVQEGKERAFSQIVKGTGITVEGALCNNFPSIDCPFRINATWTPVCGGNSCDSTKSMRVNISVTYDPADSLNPPQHWSIERLLEPRIQLTASVACARAGGVFRGNQCLMGAAAERIPASDRESRMSVRAQQETPIDPYANQGQQIPEQNPYICPDRIVIQGMEETPYIDATGKARVEIPASNGCPNAVDIFVFQCAPVNQNQQDQSYDGQWVQTEAILAPVCDERGIPYNQQ